MGESMFDRYTKIILTVIALALSAIALEGSVGRAQAQAEGCGSAYNPCYVQPGGMGTVPMPVYIVGAQR